MLEKSKIISRAKRKQMPTGAWVSKAHMVSAQALWKEMTVAWISEAAETDD